MNIGFIGLGKMGLNMVKKLKGKHKVFVYGKYKSQTDEAKKYNAIGFNSIKELAKKLPSPKIIWTMVPSGKATNEVINELSSYLSKNDIIIDGGNSYYKGSMEIAKKLKKKGISFLDIGTSGGIWGLEKGFCFMVGGEEKTYKYIKPILKDLSVKDGYQYIGKSGAGHFIKMVHNGIEYGMLQAYAEGFHLMENKKEFSLDLKKISKLWNKNSVIRSWLLELLEAVFKKDQKLKNIKGYIEESGEGRWCAKEGIEEGISLPIISLSLMQRFSSKTKDSFHAKIIASLRNAFGGHSVKKGKK